MATSNVIELIIQAKDLASKVLKGTEAALDGMSKTGGVAKASFTGLQNAAQNCTNTVQSAGNIFTSLTGIVAKLAVAIGAAGMARSFVEVNSSAEKTKLMLTGLYGDSAKAAEAFKWIQDEATNVPFSMSAIQDSFLKLKAAGIDPMNGSFRVLADSVSAFGGSGEELHGVMIAIQQMAGKGVISMEELRQQLAERIPTAIQAMAKGMGMSVGELQAQIEKGSVSAATGLNAMLGELQKTYGGSSQRMMASWSGLLSNVTVAWEKLMIALGATGIFDKLKSVISVLLSSIDRFGSSGTLKEWIDKVGAGFSFLWNIGTSVIKMIEDLYNKVVSSDAFQRLYASINAVVERLSAFAANTDFAAWLDVAATAIIWITDKIASLISWLTDMWDQLSQSAAWQTFKDAIGEALDALAKLFDAVSKGLPQVGALAGEHFGSAQRWIQAVVNVASLLIIAVTQIVDGFVSVGEGIGKWSAIGVEYITKIWDTVKLLVLELERAAIKTTTLGFGDTSGIDAQIKAIEQHRAAVSAGIAAMKAASTESAKMGESMKGAGDKASAGAISAEGYAKALQSVGTEAGAAGAGLEKTAKAADAASGFMKESKRSYEEWLAAVGEGTPAAMKMADAAAKSFEQLAKQQKESLGLDYKEGLISAQTYYNSLQQLDDELLKRRLENIDAHIVALKAGNEADFADVAAWEAKKDELRQEYENKKREREGKSTQDTKKAAQDVSQAFFDSQVALGGAIAKMLNGFNAMIDGLKNSISSLNMATNFEGIRNEFSITFDALTQDYKSFQDSLNTYQEGSYKKMWSFITGNVTDALRTLYLFGKDVTAMSAAQVQEWADRVTQYVQYVQDLFNQLRGQISSWQDELDQLRGNDMAILDRWYQSELDALNAKYGEELKNTKEYEEALTLLKELYAEKRKKILDDEKKAQEDFWGIGADTAEKGANVPAGAAGFDPNAQYADAGSGFDRAAAISEQIIKNAGWTGIGDIITAGAQNAVTSIQEALAGAVEILPKELNVKKDVSLNSVFNLQVLPGADTERYFNDKIWPLFENKLKLMGIKL